jgi:lipopolysaccharide biosynthesis glycosyltransferase
MSQFESTSLSNVSKMGAYCLANDGVLEWFEAFARSFRKFHASLPLTVIPYDSSVEKLKTLQTQFAFSVLDEAVASRFDDIAARLASQERVRGMFRKFCCFLGEYETFVFLDADIVVTQNLEPLLDTFRESSHDLVYFDTDIHMAYTGGLADKMIAEYQSPGFNAGAFVAHRRSMSESEIRVTAEAAEKAREFFPDCGDQPFFNYLFDTTRRRLVHARSLMPEISAKPWARVPFHYDAARDRYLDAGDGIMPFIHWAGCAYPTMVKPELFLRYRMLGMSRSERIAYRRQFHCLRNRLYLKVALLKLPLIGEFLKARDRRICASHLRTTRGS